MKNKKHYIIFLALSFYLFPLCAQINKADFARIDTLYKRNTKVYNGSVRPQWIADSPLFWYRNHERGGDFYYLVDMEKASKEKAFDHQHLATVLNKETGKEFTSGNLSLEDFRFLSKDEISFRIDSVNWNYRIADKQLTKSDARQRTPRNAQAEGRPGQYERPALSERVVSPDGKWEAFIRDHNVYVRSVEENEEIALTRDGILNHYYAFRFNWSPDSRKLTTLKIRDVQQRQIPLLESAPRTQLQPELQWRTYAKPGDLVAITLPVLFDIETKKQIKLNTELYENQYALRINGWRKDSRGFTFDFNQRGHQRYIVAEVDANTGEIRHLADEQTNTFIYYNKVYKYFLDDGAEMLWVSERDGWRHLYLLDGKNGNVKKQLTKGEWVMRDVIQVDEKNGFIYFTASGLKNNEDPYNLHYCRIEMDGKGFVDLTPENGNHQITFSTDRQFFVDTYSRPDVPPVSVLKRTSDGKTLLELEKSDIGDLLADGYVMPQVFSAKGRDGKTDIWGTIIRPSNFDSSKKYPVIEMIYAGPHDSHVSKSFSSYYSLISRTADLGFIVVSIDGMGTYNRSKAFHDVCWKNLKDAGFPDRIKWMEAAAKKHPEMDISRVGIYGWSAGGQSSLGALLFHNDFYKVAVAFCGCHDNRMDKMWWNEQWMGYPLDESYSASSNVDNAHLLKGKLLLVNGELDDNVDPASTLQVVKALMDAGKNFDQLYLPGKGHSLGSSFEIRKMNDFFIKHLMGQDPPEWE